MSALATAGGSPTVSPGNPPEDIVAKQHKALLTEFEVFFNPDPLLGPLFRSSLFRHRPYSGHTIPLSAAELAELQTQLELYLAKGYVRHDLALGFYRRFYPRFSDIAAPLTRLTSRGGM